MIKIEFDGEVSMDELIEAARREWAQANIQTNESYLAFARRIGVSYRTVLRWLGRLNTTERIIQRGITITNRQPFDISVLPTPLVWAQQDIRAYHGPLVYVVMKEDAAVYVGSSQNGALRLLASHDREEVILNASHILFYPCPTRHDAKRLESQLLRQYQPAFNVNQT